MKILVCIFVLSLLVFPGFCEDSERDPTSTVCFFLIDSFAFSGLLYEIFLGQIGLGLTCSTFIPTMYVIEPGAYIHLYLGDMKNSLFLLLDTTIVFSPSLTFLNFNTGIGFNAFFGQNNTIRLAVELGPRYCILSDNNTEINGAFLPHFKFMFGFCFY